MQQAEQITVRRGEGLYLVEQSYPILSAEEFKPVLKSAVEEIDALRKTEDTLRKLSPSQNFHIVIIASTIERQALLRSMVELPHGTEGKITVVSELFPFEFHAYRWRGRSAMMVIVDDAIAQEFFDGYDSTKLQTNHQCALGVTLSTICFAANREYKECYHVVSP